MDKILSIECVEKASKFLTKGLTRILDTLAPLKTVQTRSNYAPHISEETKDLQRQRGQHNRRQWSLEAQRMTENTET